RPVAGTRRAGPGEPDGAQSGGERAVDVAGEAVADHRRLPGVGVEQGDGPVEDGGRGLADAEVAGDDDGVEAAGEAGRGELLALEAGRAVGDQTEPMGPAG